MVACLDVDGVGPFAQRAVGVEIMLGQNGFQLLGQLVPGGQKLNVIALFRVGGGAAAQKGR